MLKRSIFFCQLFEFDQINFPNVIKFVLLENYKNYKPVTKQGDQPKLTE